MLDGDAVAFFEPVLCRLQDEPLLHAPTVLPPTACCLYRTKRGLGLSIYLLDLDHVRARKASPLCRLVNGKPVFIRPSYGELPDAHRQMVVVMAQCMWRGDIKQHVLIEYGMLGLSIAAQPPRPSKTKKGAMVGFDPTNATFSTYARAYAKKEMALAVSGEMASGDRKEPEEQAVAATFEAWAAKDDGDAFLKDAKGVVRCLSSRDGLTYRCSLPGLLWRPPEEYGRRSADGWAVQFQWALFPQAIERRPQTAPQLRSWIKHPRTETELRNLKAYYGNCHGALGSHEAVAKDGMKGWKDKGDGEGNEGFLLASFMRSHAQNGKEFRLPKKVKRARHKLGKQKEGLKRQEPLKGCLGLFDKFGRWLVLPDYPPEPLGGAVIVRPLILHVDYRGLLLRPLPRVPFYVPPYEFQRFDAPLPPHPPRPEAEPVLVRPVPRPPTPSRAHWVGLH